MAKYEISLTQSYSTPIAAARGWLDGVIAFLESGGIQISNKINTNTPSMAETTFDITAPFTAKVKFSVKPTTAYHYLSVYGSILNDANVAIVSANTRIRTITADTQLASDLALIVTEDYVGLFDKKGLGSHGGVETASNIFTAMKAKNVYSGAYDWFYNLAQPTATSGYMQMPLMYSFYAVSPAQTPIYAQYPNTPTTPTPLPSANKYIIRPVTLYDSHISDSTYTGCIGDQLFSNFTAGGRAFYRDIWFLNEL